MVFYVSVNKHMNQMMFIRQSTFDNVIIFCSPDSPFCIVRQRREHRVFAVLLQMVPNLEARLMEGDDDDVVAIADLVRCIWLRHALLLSAFQDPKGSLEC